MKKKAGNGNSSSLRPQLSSFSTKDGPTSVVVLGGGNGNELTLRQRIQKSRFQRRRRYIENHLKEEHHSMEDVGKYLKEKYGFVELKPDLQDIHGKYYREYEEMRTSFMRQYAPELLERADEAASPVVKGGFSGFKLSPNAGEAEVRKYVEQLHDQMENEKLAAKKVPGEVFDIDLHIYEKEPGIEQDKRDRIKSKEENLIGNKSKSRDYQQITLEFRYGYIGGGAGGTKKNIHSFNKILRDLYVYYGVTQEDIAGKTRRYQELVRTLARR